MVRHWLSVALAALAALAAVAAWCGCGTRLPDVAEVRFRQFGCPSAHAPIMNAQVAVSPTGETLALATGSPDGTARLWDVATGRQTGKTLPIAAGPSGDLAVAFSPDGKTL